MKKYNAQLPEFHCSSLERCTQEECCDHGESSGLTMLHSTVAEFKEEKRIKRLIQVSVAGISHLVLRLITQISVGSRTNE